MNQKYDMSVENIALLFVGVAVIVCGVLLIVLAIREINR